jgi:hypothetical protein
VCDGFAQNATIHKHVSPHSHSRCASYEVGESSFLLGALPVALPVAASRGAKRISNTAPTASIYLFNDSMIPSLSGLTYINNAGPLFVQTVALAAVVVVDHSVNFP